MLIRKPVCCSALIKIQTNRNIWLNYTTTLIPEILNVEKVKKGDCFFIPAGTVHAIEKGCFIAEIQQTSDITYRIYDYDRRDKNGNARELHTELATDVIHFNSQKEHSIPYHRHENHTEELVDCNYFTTSYLKFDKEIEKDYIDIDSFVIYMCLDGNFTIVYDTDQSIQVKKGETILVPACLKNIFLIRNKKPNYWKYSSDNLINFRF